MSWLISVMVHFTYISGKNVSKVIEVVNQVHVGGGAILCFQHSDFSNAILMAKFQINWANIDQVMALCAKWHH